ncbi:helix-turn-helix domain-containing protein [Flagellimonas algicola]|uniref:Helix-turn-helix transcriptional regulator n=1 Tax=Flagellimonas algicola TaxID=2583815 RepID=A0ABY2WL30_9FLAO|nr:helix-turn-helix transcriptional regulator [Allomuricauda algicola]TMU55553.1 helix-turn-helix transcriptional regulator [Allomuricauda algicola]
MAKKLSQDEKEFLKTLGERIRKIRKSQNLTQQDLGFQAQVHDNLVGRVERGEMGTNVLNLYKLAKVLNVDLNEFLEARD